MEIAKSLVDYLEGEIEMLKKCAGCYSNAYNYPNTWFTMAYNEVHLIVWARKIGFNFWPAKVIAINGELVHVHYFGDHKYADVPPANCFLYSSSNPNRSRRTSTPFKCALNEANEYMKNIRQKFGSYHLFEAKTAFYPKLLGEYIVQAIPKLAGSQMLESIKSSLRTNLVISSVQMDASMSEQPISTASIDDLSWKHFSKRPDQMVTVKTEPAKKKVDCIDQSLAELEEDIEINAMNMAKLSQAPTNIDNNRNNTISSPMSVSNHSFNVFHSNQSVQQLEPAETGGFNDITEIPNKMRRLATSRTPVSNSTSVSNANQFDQDHESSATELKKLDESIENMKMFRNSVNLQILTNQTLRHELETLKKLHVDCEAKNNGLIQQLNAVCAERDNANLAESVAKNELAMVKAEHANEIRAMKKAHDEAAKTAKVRIEMLQQDKEGLRKGLEASHTTMLEFQRKLDENHYRELSELRKVHDDQLQRALAEIETLKTEVKQKTDIEAQLKKKCEHIVNHFKAKVDSLCGSTFEQLWQNE
ncbi:MYND-type zinc finger-containing chromatin reader Zmynd8-like [Sitodiplosis mosellana]|uniref:MYND-type zinc finger-containing chromatin reader Zmynd8-like n=1 Tax=Sitodiplosis mosellana TaxID=263140 RepID=UPI0024449A1F|nr:MYND-type zinc finger-containing chromatin reader Zmynd8-like [Sitodiplosis mosellana]